jgi:hypothetical protein
MAYRTGLSIALEFPSIFWKKLIGDPVDISDLAAIDQICCQSLETLKKLRRKVLQQRPFLM